MTVVFGGTMADTHEPGCPRADDKREPAGSGRKHVTSRMGTAVTICSAVFCGCAATVFLWAIPAVGRSGPAMVGDRAGPHQAGGGGADATAPPGGTVRYVLHVDAPARNTVVRASAGPGAATVLLSCPAGAEGPVCRISTAGLVDIPASVYVPVSFVPGTVIRITEVASGKSGVTVHDTVIEVVAAPGLAADPGPSARSHPRSAQPLPRSATTRSSQPPPRPGHTPRPTATAKPAAPRQSTPDRSQPADTATPAPAPGLGSAPASVPGLGGAPTVSPSSLLTPVPRPSSTPTPRPSPGTPPAPGLGSPDPSPTDPVTKAHSSPRPTHRATPTVRPAHSTTPKPSRTAPPAAADRQHPQPVRSSHPAMAGIGHAAPPGGGKGMPGAPACPGPLPLPSVKPGSAHAAGTGQANAGRIDLPPADRPAPAPAPILPSARLAPRVRQPSPLPLPRVTVSATDPSAPASQAVVLPNRVGTASNDQSSAMNLVEAQIIGLSIALGGALAALLRPVRNRAGQSAGQRPERPGAGARRPRAGSLPSRTLRWLRADRR